VRGLHHRLAAGQQDAKARGGAAVVVGLGHDAAEGGVAPVVTSITVPMMPSKTTPMTRQRILS
jgi:hypothetical protein